MWSREDAVLYDQWYASPVGAFALAQQKQLLQHVMSRWPRRGCSLLDIGCGTGLLSEFLWQGGFDVSCLDQSPAMLEYAQARLGHRASFYAGTAEHLPFDDRSFDYAALLGVLEHLEDPRPALAEALRVAARGVVFGFLNACSPARAAGFFRKSGASLFMPHGPRWLTPRSFCRLARSLKGVRHARLGSVLIGPPCTWREGGLCAFVNALRLPLPVGAYVAVSVMHGPSLTLTPLPLRMGEVGLKEASPHMYMFQSTSGSVRRMTPPRRAGAGWIAPSLKGGVTGKACPPLPGVKRESP
jgi:SAM-dependent methyltransferase